jgi:hypothetical protein
MEAGLDLATILFEASVTAPLAALVGVPTAAVGVALVGGLGYLVLVLYLVLAVGALLIAVLVVWIAYRIFMWLVNRGGGADRRATAASSGLVENGPVSFDEWLSAQNLVREELSAENRAQLRERFSSEIGGR